ncbi:MAG: VCBS repeat-containing protein, partial [Myxococcota bacterium]
MRVNAFPLIVLVGCTQSVSTDFEGAVIACGSEADCPDDLLCIDGLCEERIPDDPPRVLVEVVGGQTRFFDAVPLRLTVINADSETTTLTIEVDVLNGEAVESTMPATLSASDVESGPLGSTAEVQFDVATFFGDAARREFRIRIRGADSDGIGDAAETSRLIFGNTAPSVTFSNETRSELGTLQSGDVVVTFSISDADRDSADVMLEFRTGAGSWLPVTLGGGISTGLATDEALTYFLIWDSTDRVGGVGSRNADGVELRITASDNPDGAPAQTFGVPDVVGNVSVTNRDSIRLDELRAVRAEVAGGQSPIPITYTLVQDTNALFDLEFEYSFDAGLTFQPCQEYVGTLSEGRSGQISSAEGVPHTFIWDPAGTAFEPSGALIRVTAIERGAPEFRDVGVIPLLRDTGPVGDGGPFLTDPRDFESTLPNVSCLEMNHGDFNEDDWTDSVIFGLTSAGGGGFDVALRFFTNDGDGTFTLDALALPLGNRTQTNDLTRTVAVNDFDLDGNLDLAAVGNPVAMDSNGFTVFFGDGAGAFPSQSTVPAAASCDGLAVGDFLGDTTLEIAAFCGSGAGLRLYRFDSARTLLQVGDAYPGSRNIVAGEFNGDANLDLVAWSLNSLVTLTGDGQGSFTTSSQTLLSGVTSTEVIDRDGDGVDELLIASNTLQSDFVLRRNQQSGEWEIEDRFVVASGQSQLVVGDLNGDGIADFVDGRELNVFVGLRNGGPTGEFAQNIGAFGASNDALTVVELFDADNDGRDEFVTCFRNPTGNTLRLTTRAIRQTSGVLESSVAAPAIAELPSTTSTAVEPVVADLDNDGRLDVVAGEETLFFGSGTGAFGAGTFDASVELGDGGSTVRVADLDGDGVDELVAVTSSMARVFIRDAENLRAWNTTEIALASSGFPSETLFAELDGNGFPDLVLLKGNTAEVLLGTGVLAAPFQLPAQQYALPLFAVSGGVADFDRDGNVDLVVGSNSGSPSFAYCPGDGSSGFDVTSCVTLSDCTGGTYVAVVDDFDADGILDVSMSRAGFSVACTYLGGGSEGVFDGSFASVGQSGSGGRGLALVNLQDSNFAYFNALELGSGGLRGRGSGAFGERPTGRFTGAAVDYSAPGVGRTERVSAGDFNRDGHPDFVTLSNQSDRVSVYVAQNIHIGQTYQRLPDFSDTVEAVPARFVGLDLTESGSVTESFENRRSIVVRPALQVAGADSFLRRIRGSAVYPPAAVVPIQGPYEILGGQRLERAVVPESTTGPRLRVIGRLGNLDATQNPPRAMIVTLSTYPDVSSAGLSGKTLHVLR